MRSHWALLVATTMGLRAGVAPRGPALANVGDNTSFLRSSACCWRASDTVHCAHERRFADPEWLHAAKACRDVARETQSHTPA
jgi:hypothetical protein